MDNAMLKEYDDILIALRNERLSAKIIAPVQLNQLIKQSTILYDTLYVQSPYLMYIMAKMSFNLQEASADNASILRGALIIPLIKRQKRVIVSVTTKEENGSLKVF
ncbi:unnamed protein product [Bemisia tabaci]|uniref:Uncharacterized protein n=1 Tax=Bemisia tabaci TaxID=7038 RepID=A0A9P0A8E8_BEMTA|nr:unnamed protein product [Bemisia tabaci]